MSLSRDLPPILREAAALIGNAAQIVTLEGMRYPIIDELQGFAYMLEDDPGLLKFSPMGENLDGEDDDHPLWGINAQIDGLLEGFGATEDHEGVRSFLRATGLPESTVARIHNAIIFGDTKVLPSLSSVEAAILNFATTQWGERTDEKVALKACGECGEFAEAVTKIGEGRATHGDADEEVGDILIVLSQWAAKRGTTLETLRAAAFAKVQARAKTPVNFGPMNWTAPDYAAAEARLHRKTGFAKEFAAPYGNAVHIP